MPFLKRKTPNSKFQPVLDRVETRSGIPNFWCLEFGHWSLRKGFTLIELLVVITIIALLISAVSASFTHAQAKSRDGRRKSDLKSVQQALEMYMQTYGRYPSSTSGVITCSGGAAGTNQNGWGSIFQCPSSTGPIFAQQLPKDPAYQTDANKGYYYENLSQFTYTVSADLENDNDQDRIAGTDPCDPAGSRDFCVENP